MPGFCKTALSYDNRTLPTGSTGVGFFLCLDLGVTKGRFMYGTVAFFVLVYVCSC